MGARLVIGIDPGLEGAIAFLDIDQWLLEIHDMPTFTVQRNGKNRGEMDCLKLGAILKPLGDTDIMKAFLEKVGAMPKQGGASMFTFGRGVGALEGAIGALELPFGYVTPQTWKKHFKLTKEKDEARRKASAIMPACGSYWRLKGQHGRAEAALIALWGATVDLGIDQARPIRIAELALAA